MEAASPGDAAVPPRPFLRVPGFGSSSSMPPISRMPRIGNLRTRLNRAIPHMSRNRRFATSRVGTTSAFGTFKSFRLICPGRPEAAGTRSKRRFCSGVLDHVDRDQRSAAWRALASNPVQWLLLALGGQAEVRIQCPLTGVDILGYAGGTDMWVHVQITREGRTP
jgi:hypothetical protein